MCVSRDKAKNDKILIIVEFKERVYVCSLYTSTFLNV